jgi:hypothetical protein
MSKPVYIFAGLTVKSVDSIVEQIKKDKQGNDTPNSDILLVFGETLPEFGKRVTADNIDDISFAEFIQDIIKREDLAS